MGRIVLLGLALLIGCRGGDDERVDCIEAKACGEREVSDRGACIAVGIDACADGFASDGKGGCSPLLPPMPCGDGEIAVPGDAACVPIGARACGAGFASDGKGGCHVELPAASCDAASLATPGDKACRTLAACGAGPFAPDLPSDAPVLHVDATFTGTSDGTEASPYRTIQAAIDAASSTKTTIAIAAGTYVENLDVGKPVRLHGRCPSLVTLRAVDGVKAPTIRVRADAEVVGLSITAPATAAASVVQVSDAIARIERVRIHDSNAIGLRVQRASKLTRATVRDVVVDHTVGAGAWVVGAELDAERLVVRDVAADVDDRGRGIDVESGSPTQPGTLSLRSSIIERTHDSGIVLGGSDATIASTRIHGVAGAKSHVGFGISEEVYVEHGRGSTASLDGVVIEDTHFAAWNLVGSKGTAKNLTIREGRALGDRILGPGNGIAATPLSKLPAELTVTDARIEACDDDGVYVNGAKATLKNVVVASIARAALDARSRGIDVAAADDGTQPEASIERALVSKVDGLGAFVGAGHATITASEIRDVTAAPRDTQAKGGLAVTGGPGGPQPELFATRVHVHRCQGGGAIAQAGKLSLEASLIDDIVPHVGEKTFGRGLELAGYKGVASDVSVTGSIVRAATEIGVLCAGSTLRIDRTAILGTRPVDGAAVYAAGLVVQNGDGRAGTLDLRRSLIDGAQAIGVYAIDSHATVDGTIVRAVRGTADGQFGDGLSLRSIFRDADATITRSLLRDNARSGISVFGATLSIASSRIACNLLDLDVETSTTVEHKPPVLTDLGDNGCGCAATAKCRGASSSLLPIPPP